MKYNMRFVTKGFSVFNLLRVDTHTDTCKGHSGAWLIVMLLVILMAGCNGNVSLDGNPTVTLTSPADGTTGVAINTTITATFSEVMDNKTITDATFNLKQGATAVSGTVTFSDVTAVFTPSDALSPGTVYTATISTGAKSLEGQGLASDFVWSFTTVAAGALSVSPATLTYGNQIIGTTSATQLVTITNTGSTALTVNSISNSNTTDFVFTAPATPFTINGGANQTFTVAFKPAATTGVKTTTITVESTAGTATVNANGTGI